MSSEAITKNDLLAIFEGIGVQPPIVKKKTETLTPTSYSSGGSNVGYVLVTSIPLTKPLLSVYPTDRQGWLLVPVAETRVSSTYWCLASAGLTLSGSYNLNLMYLDYDL